MARTLSVMALISLSLLATVAAQSTKPDAAGSGVKNDVLQCLQWVCAIDTTKTKPETRKELAQNLITVLSKALKDDAVSRKALAFYLAYAHKELGNDQQANAIAKKIMIDTKDIYAPDADIMEFHTAPPASLVAKQQKGQLSPREQKLIMYHGLMAYNSFDPNPDFKKAANELKKKLGDITPAEEKMIKDMEGRPLDFTKYYPVGDDADSEMSNNMKLLRGQFLGPKPGEINQNWRDMIFVGEKYLAMNMFDESIAAYKTAASFLGGSSVDFDIRSQPLWKGMGDAAMGKGDFPLALACYYRALASGEELKIMAPLIRKADAAVRENKKIEPAKPKPDANTLDKIARAFMLTDLYEDAIAAAIAANALRKQESSALLNEIYARKAMKYEEILDLSLVGEEILYRGQPGRKVTKAAIAEAFRKSGGAWGRVKGRGWNSLLGRLAVQHRYGMVDISVELWNNSCDIIHIPWKLNETENNSSPLTFELTKNNKKPHSKWNYFKSAKTASVIALRPHQKILLPTIGPRFYFAYPGKPLPNTGIAQTVIWVNKQYVLNGTLDIPFNKKLYDQKINWYGKIVFPSKRISLNTSAKTDLMK